MAVFTAPGFAWPKQPPYNLLLYPKQLPPYSPSINMWGGSSLSQPRPPLLADPSDTMAITILTPWHPPDHYGPAVGTLVAQVPLILGPPGSLDHDHPMPRGTCPPVLQRTPRSLVILILVLGCSQALWPSWPHSLDPLAIIALFQVSLLHRSPLVLGSFLGTFIITIPCSWGLPDALGMAPYSGFPKAPSVPCSWDPMTTGTPWTH